MADDDLVEMKEQVYKDPRPKEHFDRFHARSRTRKPDLVYEAVRVVTSLWSFTALRARCIGADNVPARGAVIVAPNHFSFMDHFLMGAFIRRQVRFMAKSQLFADGFPGALLTWIYTHGGVFPIRRGHRDEEAILTAETILAGGGCLGMYPEAGRSRTGKLGERAKPGIGRLALETGTPIVPTAIYGSAKVRNYKRLQFPKVVVQYGEPLRFPREANPSRERQQEVADEVFAAIKALYAGLEQEGTRTVRARLRAKRRELAREAKKRPAFPA